MEKSFSARLVARVAIVRRAPGVQLRKFDKRGVALFDRAKLQVAPGAEFTVTDRDEYARHVLAGTALPIEEARR